MKIHCLILSTLIAAGAVRSETVKIELPSEKIILKEGQGREVVMANCLMCHSTEYYTTQPPLTGERWQAIVEKMKKTFGAPMPDDQVKVVVDYLTTNYGPDLVDEPTKP